MTQPRMIGGALRRPHVLCALSVLAMLLCAARSPRAQAAEPAIDFNRQIRPLLSDKCFACHGPDENKRDSDLRLDTKEGALKDLGGHFAIVAGRAEQSEVVARISSTDPERIMPPSSSGKKLSPDEISLLRRWIIDGAKWEEPWAYMKPVAKAIPRSAGAVAGTAPIDGFIRAKLSELGLAPTAEADRVTLIRRLHFDLVGLPPTPEEVAQFVRDQAPDAYEKLVARLLTSPHHGERMAMYWLDAVRYADTTGYHGDNHRDVSLYRDYVIAAFNNNKRFDRFTIEQLAGDLLPDASDETRVASGYNHMLMTTREGGAQPKEYIAKYAADRVRNASTVWLGATLGCAQCHDHKFDPYLTRDFYSFAAFFSDIKEIAVGEPETTAMPSAAQRQRIAEFDLQIAAAKKSLDTQTPELEESQAAWEKSFAGQLQRWSALKPTSVRSRGGATLKMHDSGIIVANGENPFTDTITVTAKAKLAGITAVRLEALPDSSLPSGGPGRAKSGNFALTDFRISGSPLPTPDLQKAAPPAKELEIETASADFSQKDYNIAAAIDSNESTGWAIAPEFGKLHVAVFELREPLAGEDEKELTFTLTHNHSSGYGLGRFRLSVTAEPRPVRPVALTHEVLSMLAVASEQRTPEQRAKLAAAYRGLAPALEPVRTKLSALQKDREAFMQSVPTTLVAVSTQPRQMRILPRGNWLDETGTVVDPAVPAFLPPLDVSGRRATRLDLAHWLVARDNPLVARVFVNRLWKLMFGQGIVKSLDDFGAQGAAPTHPELLDWLAIEFINSGWDVRHMLRLIATSATYRQSSVDTPQLRQIDPYNRWLARQGRFRMDAEFLRDNALAVSGLLSHKIGGPSAKPYQPAGYWSHLNFPVREYQPDHGESLYRRGLYTYWCRTFLHPSLAAFDAPSREECTVERPRSNTPLQALVLLNDPMYVEAARAFSQRIVKEGGSSPSERINWAFRQALSRNATARELELLGGIFDRHLKQYEDDPPSAERLLKIGEWPAPKDVNATELAAWTSVARVILNLHEIVTRS